MVFGGRTGFNLGSSVYSAPIVADGVLYIATREHLIAIKAPSE